MIVTRNDEILRIELSNDCSLYYVPILLPETCVKSWDIVAGFFPGRGLIAIERDPELRDRYEEKFRYSLKRNYPSSTIQEKVNLETFTQLLEANGIDSELLT